MPTTQHNSRTNTHAHIMYMYVCHWPQYPLEQSGRTHLGLRAHVLSMQTAHIWFCVHNVSLAECMRNALYLASEG